MFRKLAYLLLTAPLLPGVPAEAVLPPTEPSGLEQQYVPAVYTRAQLDAYLVKELSKAPATIRIRLMGELNDQWRDLLTEDNTGEFVRSYHSSYTSDGILTITPEYREMIRLRAALRDSSKRAALSAEDKDTLREAEQRVRSLVRPGMSDMEKLKAIHDSVVAGARYDLQGGNRAHDILCRGVGLCEAYSAAMCVLCEVAGIPCRMVMGTGRNERHGWNLVKFNGAWYHLDATWDDPVIGDGSTQVVNHTFFLLTDEEMAATHKWNRALYPPSGVGSCIYFRLSGIYFTSTEAYWNAAMAAYRRGDESFLGYLTTYGNSEAFYQHVQKSATADSPRSISISGPDTPAGAVRVKFMR